MVSRNSPLDLVPTAPPAGTPSELELLEKRHRRLKLEAEVAAVEEEIARQRLTTSVATDVEIAAPPQVVVPSTAAANSPPPIIRPALAPVNAHSTDNTNAADPSREPEIKPEIKKVWLLAVPSWLVSMAVHMIVLVALAMLWLPKVLEPQTTMIEGGHTEPTEELLQPSEVRLQLDTSATEVASVAHVVADLGATDVGSSLALPNAVTAYTAADLETSELTEVGSLFGTTGKGMASVGQGSGGAEFFGVKAAGNRFVFIVDSSNSMRGDKFKDACEELMYAIRRLNSKQYFYVIFFDQDAERMTFAPNNQPEASFANATAGNIKKVEDWVKTVQNELKTDPYDAVVFGCSIAPDAIYLLTDGRFTDKGATERFLKKNNLFREPGVGIVAKAVIHTVGFYDPAGEETLQRIAADHKGTYRFVPRPKK